MKGKIARLLAFVLAVVAFCMMFVDQVQNVFTVTVGGTTIGEPTVTVYTSQQVLFGEENLIGSTFVFVAYLLIVIGGVLLLMTGLFSLKKRANSFMTLFCVLLMLFGGITVFFTKDLFVGAQTNSVIVELFNIGEWSNTAGPIVAGILAILSSLVALISIPLTNKK